jgi:hypothetical protein
MADQEQHADACTYADRLVQLTPEMIRIPWFYFPCGTKRIRLADIERVEILPNRLATGAYRMWGSGDLRTWFGLDGGRPSRKWIYIVHLRARWKRVGLTVEDDERFQAALTANGIELQTGSAEEAERSTQSSFLLFMGIVISLLAVVLIGLAIPLIAERVPPNGSYGFRTDRTLSDPSIWYPVNRFGGILMLIAGAVPAFIGPILILKRRKWPLWAGIVALIGTQVTPLLMIGITAAYANTVSSTISGREQAAAPTSDELTGNTKPPTIQSHEENGRLVDRIDYPFVNDSALLGKWGSIDFVSNINEFTPAKRTSKTDLFLKEVSFLPNGRVTPQTGWTWTRGLVLNRGDRTASQYEIQEIDGKKYLFLEWKSGDYTLHHCKPQYYVLQQW